MPTKKKKSQPSRTSRVENFEEMSSPTQPEITPETLQMLDDRYSKQSPSKLLILLLVAVSFFAGYLLKKVKDQDVNKAVVAGAQTAQPTTQGQQPAEPDLAAQAKQIAKKIGLDEAKFNQCVDSGKFSQKIAEQQKEGTDAGIQATPSNVIYDQETDTAILVEGALPYEQLKQAYEDFKAGKNQDSARKITVKKPDAATENWRGNADARYVWIEYSDLQCPFCKREHPDLLKLTGEYKDEMAYNFRHFPLSFHQYAQKLAESAECARDQKGLDAFWQMVDQVFEA